MSPEQAEGKLSAIGPASDVYSLGATLYVLLTNRRPFEGEPALVILAVQQNRFTAPVEINPRVPKALDAVCRRAMSLEPSKRYPSALALAEEIERWLADEPVSAWDEPAPVRARRWVGRHQALVTGYATALAVVLIGLSVAVPLLSLAWRNEAVARRSQKWQYLLAVARPTTQKSRGDLPSQTCSRPTSNVHWPRLTHLPPGKKRSGRSRHSSFWSRPSASPTPRPTAARSKSLTSSITPSGS